MPSLDLSLSVPPVVAVLLFLASGTLSFFFYRFTVPAVSRSRRLFLSILRGIVLAIIFLLLCEPLLRLVFITRHPPIIAVLVDNSASMSIADRSGSRVENLMGLLQRDIPAAAPAGSELRYYTFGVSLRGPFVRPADSLGQKEELTDIASALRGLAAARQSSNIRAAVLLTDGVYTIGQNPVREADGTGIPIFTVGIGDTAEQKDILVSRLAVNDLVYAGTEVPVDVTVKSTGFAGDRVEITLDEGRQILGRATIPLPLGTAETSVHLSYTPEKEGIHRYTVRVSPREGELTTANNQREFTVRVLKSKICILILAGAPSPDLTAVRQTLAEQKNFTVRVRIQRATAGFYDASLNQADLDSADCLVTIGLPTASTPPGTLQLINAATRNRRTPLLFIAGKSIDLSRVPLMAPSFPVSVELPSSIEQEVDFVPDPGQRTNPLLTLEPPAGISSWSRLPPVFSTQTVYTIREGAIVLGAPRLHNILLPQPLMASRNLMGMKSLAFLGYGIWRWRLMAQGSQETAQLLPSFLSTAVFWLTSRDAGKALRVAPTKDAFARGEQIAFGGQLYNANAQPVEKAEVNVTITGGEQSVEAELRPIGSGRYEGGLDGLPHGEYRYRARAVLDGTTLGDDNGSFTVGGLNVEFLDTRMNAALLRQLAYRTGGAFFTADLAVQELRTALDSLRVLSPREERSVDSIELHQWHYALGFLIILLAAEWIARKNSGML